jgi:excinuclease ABC subunit B
MAEELAKYLTKVNIRCRYISDIDTLGGLKSCKTYEKDYLMFDWGKLTSWTGFTGSITAILDADKEGFT